MRRYTRSGRIRTSLAIILVKTHDWGTKVKQAPVYWRNPTGQQSDFTIKTVWTGIIGANAASDAPATTLTWRQHHGHLTTFEPGLSFDLGDWGRFLPHPVEKLHPKLLMSHFTTAETKGDLDFVAFIEESASGFHLHFVIVNIDVRPHLDFLDIDRLLLLARLGGFLLRGEFEAAVIEDLCDRGLGIGSNFNEIKTRFGGHFPRFVDRHIAVIGALVVDQLNFVGTDIIVDPRPILGRGWRSSVGSANGGILLYCCCLYIW